MGMAAVMTLVGGIGLVGWCDAWTRRSAQGRLYDHAELLPPRSIGLVLGTAPVVRGGRTNLFFRYRMEAAAELFHARKVRHLLLSGDNGHKGYDEPSAMRDALLALGVPDEAMTLDYAGFRTLDSIVRARNVFGQSQLIIISQAFHNERAIAIAQHYGVDAIAYNAPEVGGAGGLRTSLREYAARVKCVADLFLLNTQPRFGGPEVPIPLSP